MERSLLLVLLAAIGSPLGADNLIENGEVRDSKGWGLSAPAQVGSFDGDVGAAKKGSLRIRNSDASVRAPYNWNQRVELPKKLPARLKLTAQVRTEGLSANADACAMVQIFSEPDKAIGYAWADHVKTDGDWRSTKAVFAVPSEAKYVRVLAYFAGGGTAWFDDLALEATTDPVTGETMGGTPGEGPMEKLARGCAADLPWCFGGDEARARATKESKPILVYVRCTDAKDGLASARSSIEAAEIPLSDDGYAKDLLFRAGPLSSPEVRDLVARRTVPMCATYVLGEATYGADSPAGWGHTAMPGAVSFTLDRDQGKSTKGALRIECRDASSKAAHNWFQSVEAPSSRPMNAKLRVHVRTADMGDASEVCVLVNCFGKDGQVGGARMPEVRSNTDWKQQETSFDIPKECERLSVLAYLVGAGSAWFDDFSIEIKGERGKKIELLENGGLDQSGGKLEGFDIDPRIVTTPALVLADSHGKVVRTLHRIGTLSDDLVDWWLREAIAESGAKSKSTKLEELYRDGELDKVLAMTKTATDPASKSLRARAQLRLGQCDDALRTVAQGTDPASVLAIGTHSLRAGNWSAGLEAFENLAKRAQGDAGAEAKFWSAWCLDHLGRHADAKDLWKEIAGESPLGRRAAACLLDAGPRLPFAASTLAWPRTANLPDQTERGVPGDVDVARSVALLLEMQRGDGSFGEQMGADGLGYEDGAITSIAVDALLHVDRKLPSALSGASAAARTRALEFLRRFARDDSRHPAAMEPFNDPYTLRLFVQLGEREPAESLAARIARSQLPDGNWTVYNPERPASFNTALCVMALHTTKEAGFAISDPSLAKGLAALEKMRQPSGRFPYSTAAGHDWMTTEWGSIARDPLCEHVLLACGSSSRENLASALERYLTFHAELRPPTKRLYDYFDTRGHGGYYFFFAHRNALEAARAFARPELAQRVERAARDAVTSAMEGDGSFMDKFLLGRAYGTAMALLIVE